MSYHASRPNRASETFARSRPDADFDDGLTYEDGRPAKKPRFDLRNPSALAPDALEDDAVLDADVIGTRGQQVRRGAVNVDGYDSDSDNENFDTRAEVKAKQKQAAERRSKEEEDNDMFADLQEDFREGDDSEGDAGRRGTKKKAVRFLNEDEIEGQVRNSRSGGHVSADFSMDGKGKAKSSEQDMESSSDSEVDDETRASHSGIDAELGAGGKKSHAPKLDAFNMRSENEEGRFDESGNYVRKATDPDTIHDSWLEGVSKKDMKKAKEAHEKREQERRQKAIEDDSKPTGAVLTKLIPLLEPGETILEALARLNRSKVRKPKWQSKSKRNKMIDAEPGNNEADAAEQRRAAIIEAITEAADLLLSRGQNEIYEAERELLTRQYRRETGLDWEDNTTRHTDVNSTPANKMWEYRWSDMRDGGTTHGPFLGQAMKEWNDAGYFGEGVEFRQQGTDNWGRVAAFV